MTAAAKFLCLDGRDRRLVIRALAAVWTMRLATSILPFGRLRKLAAMMSAPRAAGAGRLRPTPERIAWSVAAASKFVPGGGNCLVRALATEVTLARFGYPSELRIGVAKGESGEFKAHAWLESAGIVVIGDFQLDEYVPLRADDPGEA